jgi:hypothetical protein
MFWYVFYYFKKIKTNEFKREKNGNEKKIKKTKKYKLTVKKNEMWLF